MTIKNVVHAVVLEQILQTRTLLPTDVRLDNYLLLVENKSAGKSKCYPTPIGLICWYVPALFSCPRKPHCTCPMLFMLSIITFFQTLKFVDDYGQVKYDSGSRLVCVRSLLFFLNICKSQSLRYGILNQWTFFTTISRYYKVFMLFVFVFWQFSVKRNLAHNMTFAYIMCKYMN